MSAEQLAEDRDSLYAALNVPRTASAEDVKRSYRSLAQIYHPDKHTDPELKARAIASFTRLQAAYEVLGDEAKRQVYDVYGQQGLEAGLEVVPRSRGSDVREQWEQFKKDKAAKEKDAEISHRGRYVLRVDASEALHPYDTSVSVAPELTSLAMEDVVQIPVLDDTTATIGCQAAMRKGLGRGAFICGVRRSLDSSTSVEGLLVAGLKGLLSLSTTHAFANGSTSTLTASVSRDGVGMQLSTSQRITDRWDAEAAFVLGAGSLAGISLTLNRRFEKILLTARIELGLQTSASLRCIWSFRENTTARIMGKASMSGGLSLELGCNCRLSPASATGCNLLISSQGVLVKPLFSRGSHVFEAPVLLSQTPLDARALAAATLLPPLISAGMHYLVLRPLRKRLRVQQALKKQKQATLETRRAAAAAAGAAQLMQPVAHRKAAQEASQGGLIIVDAKYGSLDPIMELERHLASRAAAGQASDLLDVESAPAAAPAPDWEPASEDDDPDVVAAVEAALAAAEPQPPWLSTTCAVQYMCHHSQVTFHEGLSKAGLMGFCDISPGEAKGLRVLFLWRGQPHAATLLDKEGGELPSAGQAVRSGELHNLIQRLAARLDLPSQQEQEQPAPVANGTSGPNGVHAEASSSAEGLSEAEDSS